jgi:hypothetical protein
VSFFWMCFCFSTNCWPDPAVLISYTVFHNCRVLSVALCWVRLDTHGPWARLAKPNRL